MSRRSRRSQVVVEEEEEHSEEEQEFDDGDDDEAKPSPNKKSRLVVDEEGGSQDDEENDEDDDRVMSNEDDVHGVLTLQSQAPEMSQNIPKAKEGEMSKFLQLGPDFREKAVSDVLRLVLFKSMCGEPIERLKIAKETGINEAKVSNAVFEEVNQRLGNLFGLQLKQVPKFILNVQDFPPKCKDRFYLYNSMEDQSGRHFRSIHMVHEPSSIERGLLMVVLGFIFCKGDARSDGSRWLLDKDLYRLLSAMDENLPDEPPDQGSTRHRQVEGAPDVDGALDKFVKLDYLLKFKANEQFISINDQAEETSFFYSMGARAAVEIGRRNVVHFVAQTLNEEISQEILDEFNDEDEE